VLLLLMGLSFGALFAWVTHTDRLLGRLPSPEVVRAARLRSMVGQAVYATAFALSWVSAPLALALCGLMALYYAFDQASVPAAVEPGHQQPTGRSAEIDDADPLAPRDGER
jgi:TMEM175 potassium channel family protein